MASGGDLVGTVFAELERLIATRRIVPGQKINENQLALELKVSRAPVREAVRRLEQYGLIDIIPHRGAVLRKLGLKDILDLYDVRAGLAYAAGRLLPTRATPADLEELRQLLAEMEHAAVDEDCAGFGVANVTFHERLFAIAGNQPLARLAAQQEMLLQSFLRDEIRNPRMLRESNTQHKAIVEAIAYNDPEDCARAFNRHIVIGKQRLVDSGHFSE